MTSVMRNRYLQYRIREIDRLYPETSRFFGHCDCTAYMYFMLSFMLLGLGLLTTLLPLLGDTDGLFFAQMGQMWLTGPIFICSALMIAVKTVMYLRRKRVIQMLLRERALLRVLAHDSRSEESSSQHSSPVARNPSAVTLPPTYEAIMSTAESHNGVGSSEVPPPTYEEAIFLIGEKKLEVVSEETKYVDSSEGETSKDVACIPSSSEKPPDPGLCE